MAGGGRRRSSAHAGWGIVGADKRCETVCTVSAQRRRELELCMRIAFYAPLKSPAHPTPSGDRRVARLYVEALVAAGHEVELVSNLRSFDGVGDPAVQLAVRSEGEAQAKALVLRWGGGSAATAPALWFTYHVYYKAPDWIGPAVSKSLGIPYAIAEASYAAKRAAGDWADGHAAATHAICAADLLVCPTRDDMVGLRQAAAARANLLYLPPFLDPAPYRDAARQRAFHRNGLAACWRLEPAVPWIIVSAMMRLGDKLASYRMLARTLGQLTDLRWNMLVAGAGPAADTVRSVLDAAAPGRVRFAGECSAAELAAMYAASDLCVWPAVNEAYGMAMLEAQAAGTPVVSCANRGVVDVVRDGETGLLAPAGDEPGLALRIRHLLQDAALRTALGSAAAKMVVEERSTGHAARSLADAIAALQSRRLAA